jgi:alkylated DNA repair dioxygenase AlkB
MAEVITVEDAMERIPGFFCYGDVVTEKQEKEIMDKIANFGDDVFKQTNTYAFDGIVSYEFGYQFRGKLDTSVANNKRAVYQITEKDKIAPFPDWVDKLYDDMVGKFPVCKIDPEPEHCIVCDYPIGKGCIHHVDHLGAFGETVVVVVLGSGSDYELRNLFTGETVRMYIPARSLYVLESNARYDWTHSVTASTEDTLPTGDKVKRERRMIVTYRSLGAELIRPPE